MSAKRNLLLGILALQNNFITRAQLLAAFNAWVEDKGQSLGALLLAQQALRAEQLALLEALVAEHLRQHGDDPDRSLAALTPNADARADLARIADPDVHASLAPLAPADPHATVSAPVVTDGSGRFRILRPHAEGGLGKVSVARDQELNREVALKEIKAQHVGSTDARARFLIEAEITGALEHPGIVPVYSLGTYQDGRPFYAMRFIKGDSLKEAIAHFHHQPSSRGMSAANPAGTPAYASLDFRKLLGRFVDVCNAIAYAHSRGVLHRDLKPGNIMLGKYGETLVVDWGLAKAGAGPAQTPATEEDESRLLPIAASGSSETLPGSALGTPAYMSPEQAAGRLDQLGPASDVYSLGATLYDLLTGTVPFTGNAAAVLKQVQAGAFAPPRQVQPAVSPALAAICLKAMALRPADRYTSARELAEDVERWLADEPVRAWPEPWTVKARRWTGRHRVLVSSAAACLVVASIALVAGFLLVSQANSDLATANDTIRKKGEETSQANAELEKANGEVTLANKTLLHANEEIKTAYGKLTQSEKEARAAAASEKKARDHAEHLLATSTMMLARSRFEENHAALADDLLEEVPPRFRMAPWCLLKNYLAGSAFTLRGHIGSVPSVAFAPDGQTLASGSGDNTVKLWDARTGQELRTLRGHTNVVLSVAFTPDGQTLASASRDNTVKLWDARTGQELRTLRGHFMDVASVAFAPDGQTLVSASYDNTIKLWDARTGQELRTLRGHTGIAANVAFAPDGLTLASGSWDNTIKLWDARTGQELRTLRGHIGGVASVAFAPDGQTLASASYDNTIKLWDARTGQELRTLRGHFMDVASVAFAPDGQTLASGSYDNTIKLWDARTGQEFRTLRGHKDSVLSVAYAPDGQTLASGSYDNTIKLWDAHTGQEPEKERRFRLWVTSPDLHQHRYLAEQADKDKQLLALAFRLGRYLAGKSHYAAEPKQAARLAGWLGTATLPPGLLAGLPIAVPTPFDAPAFPDGIACTGVLYKNSGIPPARLLIGTARAVAADPTSRHNHAFHGGALYRNGEHAKALAALNEAARLHGKPGPLTHNLLGLTYLALGQKDDAKKAFAAGQPAKDAPWEDSMLQRLLQPEIEAALADGKAAPKR